MGSLSELLLFATRNKILALLFIVVITGILGSGLPNLRIDTRLELLLDRDSAKYQLYHEAMDTFGSDNTTVFFIRDAKLFTPEKLEILQALVDEIDALEQVEKVDSLFSLTSIRNRDDSLESKIVLDILPYNQAEADRALDDALYSPLLRGNVVGESGDVTALTVIVRPAKESEKYLDRATYEIFGKIIDRYASHFDELFHTGTLRVGNDLRNLLIGDLLTLAPISIVVLFLTVGLLLRSVTMSLLPVFTSVLSTVWTFGFMGHVDIPINLLTAILPTLLLVIGATEDIHLSSAFIEAYDEGEATDRNGAVQYMANHMATAVIITTFTTSIGFLSNILSNLEIIKHFAIIASFGIVANATITFLSVPPLLSLLGPKPRKGNEGERIEHKKRHSNLLKPIADFCVTYLHESTSQHPRWVAGITAVLVLASGLILTRVSVNIDPMTFFPEDAEIIEHTNKITETLSGVLVLFITIDGHEDGFFLEPDNLQRLNRLVRHINDTGIFDRAMAHTEHLSLVNQELHDGDTSYYHPPEDADLVEQYLMFFQRSDLEPYLTSDASRANVVVRYSIYGSEQSLAEVAKLEATAKEILGPDMTVNILGNYVLVNEASRQLVNNQLKAIFIIVMVIFVIMWMLYGSWRAGLVSLMPNMIPIMFMFAIMVLMGIEINPATAMVASIVIGVAIDDTTHLLTRFNIESRKSDDMNSVIHKVVRAEAVPVIVSSLALGAGFSVLMVSQFTIMREFGFLAAIAMILALLTEFIVTPLLLRNLWAVSLWDLLSVRLPMDLLRASSLFEGMSYYQIKKLALLSRERLAVAGETIESQGDLGEEMYVIIKGRVSLHFEGSGEASGSQVAEVVYRGVGDVVGEIGLIDDVIRTAIIKVEEDVQLLVLDHSLVNTRLRYYPIIAAKLNRNMASSLVYRLAET